MLSIFKVLVSGFLALAFLVFPSLALAQGDIEEVVIEVEQTEDQLLDDLVSVSALDAEKLADAGIENVEDVAQYVPNLTLAETETGVNICIRGICAGVNQGFDQSVGLFSDGVPLPRANMARAPFLDLSSVQVKRGPQYVLDGNYAIAGSVHMISNLAVDEFKAGIDFNYKPSHNDRTLLMTVGGPVNDVFAANLVLQRKKSDGYVENVFKNRNEAQQDETLGRLVLGFNPTDSLSFKLKAEVGQFDSAGRNAEIVADLPVPDAAVRATVNGVNFPQREANTRQTAEPWLIPEDFIYRTQQVNYAQSWNPFAPITEHPTLFPGQTFLEKQGQFWATGFTYAEQLQRIYSLFEVEAPAGLGDTELDFKRAADAEEFSKNDSVNLTLGTELWLGEHRLNFTNSYIEYDLDERTDADFTPASLVESLQAETYNQEFHSLEYKSPEGAFIEVTAGAWYMESELEFEATGNIPLSDRGPFVAGGDPIVNFNYFEDSVLRTNPDIARAYFGSSIGGSVLVSAFDGFVFNKRFDQDQELFAGYLQAKIHWADTLRTILGVRYTRSEKTATRDVGLVDRREDRFINNADLSTTASTERVVSALNGFAGIFGIQSHSCRYEAGVDLSPLGKKTANDCISGTRVDEDFFPSVTIEKDVSDDLTLRLSARIAGKLGGFDALSNARPDTFRGLGIPVGTFEFRDEKAVVYEFGGKWYLPNGFGELNATAFYTDYTDLQVSRSDGKVGSLVDNAGSANNRGVELEGLLQLTDRFSVNYSLAYIEFAFEDFKFGSCHLGRRPDNYFIDETSAFQSTQATLGANGSTLFTLDGENIVEGFLPIVYDQYRRVNGNGPDGIAQTAYSDPETPFSSAYANTSGADGWENPRNLSGFCDFEGQTNQYVADKQATVSFNYENEIVGLGLFKPTLDVIYNSGYHTSASQDPLVYQDAYFLLNGRLEVASFEDVWTVAITAENLTDEKIISYATDTPIGSRFQGARGFIAFTRPPRTIGLNLRYNLF